MRSFRWKILAAVLIPLAGCGSSDAPTSDESADRPSSGDQIAAAGTGARPKAARDSQEAGHAAREAIGQNQTGARPLPEGAQAEAGPDGHGSAEIPASFAGEWNSNLGDCGTDMNDSRLRIEPRKIRFYESVGDVVKVTLRGARDVTVTARFSGEGETWTASHKMILSPTGTDLTVDEVTRHRCPPNGASA